MRIAGKDFTTLAAIQEMMEKCRVPAKVPVFGSDQPAETQAEKSLKMHGGSSRTADAKLALSAAQMLAKKLKSGLPITSPANTRRNAANVHYLKSGSRT
jgi:ABC-type sugar transport system substrate-binding protein